MIIKELLAALYQQPETIQFEQVIAAIDAEFDFKPTAFIVGKQQNAAGENQGSCKVLAFAHSAGLSQKHALLLFAEHYRAVLAEPDGSAHQNIRQFMEHSWQQVSFATKPLHKK